MAFQKFQKAESVRPVTQTEEKKIRSVVAGAGKNSAADLTDEQRKKLSE